MGDDVRVQQMRYKQWHDAHPVDSDNDVGHT
jgi:hypothetical protein